MKSTVIECDEREAALLRLTLAVARRHGSMVLSAGGGLEVGSVRLGGYPDPRMVVPARDVGAMNRTARQLEFAHEHDL